MSDLTWQAAPETAVLEHNEVHLWRVWLTQAAAADRLWPLLAADEAARARAFVFARHRQAFVTARGMLRLILSRYVGEPARSYALITVRGVSRDCTRTRACSLISPIRARWRWWR